MFSVGSKGGAETAVKIWAEQSSPTVGSGTNCLGNVGNEGRFDKHLAV